LRGIQRRKNVAEKIVKKSLTYSYMGIYYSSMPRAATTSDAFNAIAETRRRDILSYLAMQERSVTEIVDAMEMEQPSVSKHLKVLKDVGLVEVRREGRQMLYKVNALAIRPLHEWTSTFERLWKHQLLRIKERAEGNNTEKQ
jgi:DNA-binding transcriptional ArsR family regulator